jgi:hypothetical protein
MNGNLLIPFVVSVLSREWNQIGQRLLNGHRSLPVVMHLTRPGRANDSRNSGIVNA